VQIWVYGNSFESFLVAIVIPERQALEDWAAKHDLSDDFKSLCENLKARKYILDELNSVGQKHQVRKYNVYRILNFSYYATF
jgi:long-chain acyl-CoA synthetase